MVQVQETALSRSMKSDWRFEAEGKYNHKCGFSLKTLVAGGLMVGDCRWQRNQLDSKARRGG